MSARIPRPQNGAAPGMPVARRRNGHPEADIQRAIVAALHQRLPHAVVHASITEQRKGTARDQAIATGMGAHLGFSDLQVLCNGRVLFIEVKSATGQLRPAQTAFRDQVLAQGHAWALCRSVDDALAAVRAAGMEVLA